LGKIDRSKKADGEWDGLLVFGVFGSSQLFVSENDFIFFIFFLSRK